MSKEINFDIVLAEATKLPIVRIDREEFLRTSLSKYFDANTINKAISKNPASAGICVDKIAEIAKSCIDYETTKVTLLSAAAGVPGGLAIVGTVPADLAQYFAHVIRILQKLIYLYGWKELFDENGQMDDETKNLLTLFVGIMFGVNSAVGAVAKISDVVAQNIAKNLAKQPLTKGFIYPIVKQVARYIGVQMTKEIFAKGVAKIVPLIGAATGGILTYAMYKPMAIRLQKHLSKMNIAAPDFYTTAKDF